MTKKIKQKEPTDDEAECISYGCLTPDETIVRVEDKLRRPVNVTSAHPGCCA